MKKLAVGLAVLLASTGVALTTTHATPVPGPQPEVGHVTDPELLDWMQQSRAFTRAGDRPMVKAEVLTTDPVGVEGLVVALGGTITGDVPGALVQANIPVDAADTIVGIPSVSDVRAPRRAGFVPDDPSRLRRVGSAHTLAAVGFGATHGSEVESSGASLWHTAGFTGAGVKVGIIDFFDFTPQFWDPLRQGALPDAAHQFCSPVNDSTLCNPDGTIAGPADIHGDAVAEIVKDMAPDAELYLASVASVADLQAAINYFAANGVKIVTRSLGAAFDGPGDGTNSPLDAVVDDAVAKGITWFNAVGNDGVDTYVRRTVPVNTAVAPVNWRQDSVLDFDLEVNSYPGRCYVLDGVRWANDWGLANPTDYRVEVYQPTIPVVEHTNPALSQRTLIRTIDASQRFLGARPIEGADVDICPTNQLSQTFTTNNGPAAVSYIRVVRTTPVGAVPDQIEVSISGPAQFESGYAQAPFSAAKPMSDSRNPGLVAVGAVDPPPNGLDQPPNAIADYSSQGPTNDGRVKPDMTAPAGFVSDTYAAEVPQNGTTFSGTSASAPAAAGAAALVLGAGLAAPGIGLATAMKHFTTDLGAPGADNAYGAGLLRLPDPPVGLPASTHSQFVAFDAPHRLLDTRADSHVGPPIVGPFPRNTIIDLDVRTPLGGQPMTAVAINLTSVNSKAAGFLQVYPYLAGAAYGTSTLNVTYPGSPRPNFAIVPVDANGRISVALQAGGDMIIDVEGYFSDTPTATSAGRYVPLATPERWLDTRGLLGAPLPPSFGGVPRKVNASETITVPARAVGIPDPSLVDALVVNITTVNGDRIGFARAIPTGLATPVSSSNINFLPGPRATANTAIVKAGAGGQISLFTNVRVDMIVDVVGYMTSATAPASTTGLFVPLAPTRVYDTRNGAGAFGRPETRLLSIDGGGTGFNPASPIGAISANLTVTNNPFFGYVSAYPGPIQATPATSNLNYAPGETVANAALIGVNTGGATDTIAVFKQTQGDVIIDINGYFLR